MSEKKRSTRKKETAGDGSAPELNGASSAATNGAGQLSEELDDPPHPPLAPGVKYRRILLKLSGEALMGGGEYGIDPTTLAQLADEIIDVHSLGVEIALVVGGGNIFRGIAGASATAWTARTPTTWACWRRSSTRSRCRTRWSRAARVRASCRRSRWSAWPSRTSAGAPSGTWKRGAR